MVQTLVRCDCLATGLFHVDDRKCFGPEAAAARTTTATITAATAAATTTAVTTTNKAGGLSAW